MPLNMPTDLNFPAAQLMQLRAAATEYVPEPQLELHLPAAAAEYLPAPASVVSCQLLFF
jgi:hypothetical protein